MDNDENTTQTVPSLPHRQMADELLAATLTEIAQAGPDKLSQADNLGVLQSLAFLALVDEVAALRKEIRSQGRRSR